MVVGDEFLDSRIRKHLVRLRLPTQNPIRIDCFVKLVPRLLLAERYEEDVIRTVPNRMIPLMPHEPLWAWKLYFGASAAATSWRS